MKTSNYWTQERQSHDEKFSCLAILGIMGWTAFWGIVSAVALGVNLAEMV